MKIYKNLKELINKNIFDNFKLRNIVNMYWKIFEKINSFDYIHVLKEKILSF